MPYKHSLIFISHNNQGQYKKLKQYILRWDNSHMSYSTFVIIGQLFE